MLTSQSEQPCLQNPGTRLEAIRKLATAGNVILVGRGGAMITAGLRHVLRVRLVAPFEFRVRNYVAMNRVSRQKAMRTVRGNDAANRQYIRSYFGSRVSNPLHYGLIINPESSGLERAARVICRALQELMADQSGKEGMPGPDNRRRHGTPEAEPGEEGGLPLGPPAWFGSGYSDKRFEVS